MYIYIQRIVCEIKVTISFLIWYLIRNFTIALSKRITKSYQKDSNLSSFNVFWYNDTLTTLNRPVF